jgi:hypothetical protein
MLLAPLGCFAMAVSLHGLAMRLPLRADPLRRFLLAGIPVGVGLMAMCWSTFGFSRRAAAALLLYALLCELYIFAFTLVLTSVSVAMLVLLRKGAIEVSALSNRYEPRGMVQLRLERLLKQQLVTRDGERIVVTAAGRRVLKTSAALRRFFRHELS